MFNTVYFDDLNSYFDLDLILSAKEIGAPSPKVETVDVPGSDGSLDLTEFFGEVFYENRELTFDFSCKKEPYLEVLSRFKNAVHGRKMKITLSDDPYFYYVGRVSVDAWKTDEGLGTVSATVDAEPYKYKAQETVIKLDVSGSKAFTFFNLKKKVIPTFELSASMKITLGSTSVQASAGTYSNPSITFLEGENKVTFEGTGTVTVRYQERGL